MLIKIVALLIVTCSMILLAECNEPSVAWVDANGRVLMSGGGSHINVTKIGKGLYCLGYGDLEEGPDSAIQVTLQNTCYNGIANCTYPYPPFGFVSANSQYGNACDEYGSRLVQTADMKGNPIDRPFYVSMVPAFFTSSDE